MTTLEEEYQAPAAVLLAWPSGYELRVIRRTGTLEEPAAVDDDLNVAGADDGPASPVDKSAAPDAHFPTGTNEQACVQLNSPVRTVLQCSSGTVLDEEGPATDRPTNVVVALMNWQVCMKPVDKEQVAGNRTPTGRTSADDAGPGVKMTPVHTTTKPVAEMSLGG